MQILSQLQLALEWNKDIADFLAWKEFHKSKTENNYDGSSGSMEPMGLVGGAIPETNEIVTLICSCHNFFSLSSVQILFIPACCLLCVL